MIENQKNTYQENDTSRPAWEKNTDEGSSGANENHVSKADTNTLELDASKLKKEELLKQLTLTPHTYPASIKFLGCAAIVVFIAVTTNFFFYHFSHHLAFAKKQQRADRALVEEDYEKDFDLYHQLLCQAPHEKAIKIQLVKTEIALAQDIDSFIDVLRSINFSLKKEEFNSIKQYVAPEFLELFESCFDFKLRKR